MFKKALPYINKALIIVRTIFVLFKEKNMKIRGILSTLSGVFLTIIIMTGCGMQAHIDKVPGVDLSSYKTYTWIDDENTHSYTDLDEAAVKKSIANELEKKGYKQVAKGADVSIDYEIMVENQQYLKRDAVYSQPYVTYRYNPYTRRMQQVYIPSRYVGDNEYSVPYKSGTITVNLVDNKTNSVAWQGWAETEVNSKKIPTDKIEGAIEAIFKKFK